MRAGGGSPAGGSGGGGGSAWELRRSGSCVLGSGDDALDRLGVARGFWMAAAVTVSICHCLWVATWLHAGRAQPGWQQQQRQCLQLPV